MKVKNIGVACFVFFTASCSQRTPVQEDTFEINDRTSWTISLPIDWKRLSAEEIREIEKRGLEAIDSNYNGEMDASHKNFFWLEKDEANSIQANRQVFDETFGSFEDQENWAYDLILQAYDNAGMPYEAEKGTSIIDGHEFITLSISLFSDAGKQTLILNQDVWGARFNDVNLVVNCNSNNDFDRSEMVDWIKSSRFSSH